jgi:hypothetical protein
MARVNYTGFDTGDTVESSGNLNVTFSNTTRYNESGYSARIAPSITGSIFSWYALGCVAADGLFVTPNGISKNTSYTKFHTYFTMFPGVDSEFFCVFSSVAGLPLLHLFISNSGTITIKNPSLVTVATANTSVLLNDWTRIEVFFTTNGTTADAAVRINGTVVATANGLSSFSANVDQWCVGRRNTSEISAYVMFVEDFVVDDATYPGNTRIALLTPTAIGTYFGWSVSSGFGHQCVEEVPPNGGTDFISSQSPQESSFIMGDTTDGPVMTSSSYKAVKAILVKKAGS